jgi:DNA-binding NtrC family response regulator
MKSRILIIDDSSDIVYTLTMTLQQLFADSEILGSSHFGQKEIQFAPDVAVIDLCIDEKRGVESGFETIREIYRTVPSCRIIVATGHGDDANGIQCLSFGAGSFLQKPVDIRHLAELIRDGINISRLKKQLLDRSESVRDSIRGFIIGKSDKLLSVTEKVHYAASNNLSVFIEGETGTGKGLCAKAIHLFSSKRNQHRFSVLHPTFVSQDIVNSELFGHKKGSFTGAHEERKGILKDTDGGTLFLDEVDELPVETQVTLLKFLQEKTFRMIGSLLETSSNVRCIAAMNRDVEMSIRQGKLRKDFYHRLSAITIKLPSLRERKEDIDILTSHFLDRLNETESLGVYEIEERGMDILKAYTWPGNIRELQAVIESGAYYASYKGRSFIAAQDIKERVVNNATDHEISNTSNHKPDHAFDKASSEKSKEGKYSNFGFNEKVEAYKIQLIEDALKLHEGNQVKASQYLQLDRTSLRRIVKRSGG